MGNLFSPGAVVVAACGHDGHLPAAKLLPLWESKQIKGHYSTDMVLFEIQNIRLSSRRIPGLGWSYTVSQGMDNLVIACIKPDEPRHNSRIAWLNVGFAPFTEYSCSICSLLDVGGDRRCLEFYAPALDGNGVSFCCLLP